MMEVEVYKGKKVYWDEKKKGSRKKEEKEAGVER